MGLRHFIHALEQHMTERFAEVGAPAPTFHFGATRVWQQDAPPRVVWVPESSDFPDAQEVGQRRADGGVSARKLVDDAARVRAHIWGDPAQVFDDMPLEEKAYEATERLRNQVIVSLHALGVGRRALLAGAWPSATAQAEPTYNLGREFVLTFAIRIPVTPDEPAVVPDGTDTQIEHEITQEL